MKGSQSHPRVVSSLSRTLSWPQRNCPQLLEGEDGQATAASLTSIQSSSLHLFHQPPRKQEPHRHLLTFQYQSKENPSVFLKLVHQQPVVVPCLVAGTKSTEKIHLRKGKFISSYRMRLQSIIPGKIWGQEADQILSTLSKQGEMNTSA